MWRSRWINTQEPGRTVFVTTTFLDFARILERPEMRDIMARRIASDVQFYKAILHAYCVMDHHLHMLIRAPEDKTISWFMQRPKTNASKDLAPNVAAAERAQIMKAPHGSTLWMESFRGIPIRDEKNVLGGFALHPLEPNQGLPLR